MYRRIGWWRVLWVLMVTLSAPALAQSAKAMEELVEVSMLVDGDMTVDPTGKVVNYTIQDEKALPVGGAGVPQAQYREVGVRATQAKRGNGDAYQRDASAAGGEAG